jgi:hypothetical protein
LTAPRRTLALRARPRSPWPSILVDFAAIGVLWLGFALWVGHAGPVISYDAFRDAAYAQGILQGHLWADPSIPGLSAWYPPGNPLLFAGLSALTGIQVLDLYATSLYWLNWLNPVLLYALVRATWGRAVALVTLPMVLLGSFWWLLHASMPMPSVQSVSLGLLALLAWRRGYSGSARWAVVTGLLLAVAIWSHPICGAAALGGILVHGLGSVWLGRDADHPDASRLGSAMRAALAATVALVLAAPLLARQFMLARLNTAPHHWFGPELHDPRFALHAHAPLAALLGLVGLWLAARQWGTSGWLVGYFAFGLAGQAAGYLGHDARWPIPWALPHEFQWHEQLALMIAAALATIRLPELLARRLKGSRGLVRQGGGAALLALTLGPALLSLQVADSYLLHLDQGWKSTLAMAAWIRGNTPENSVFACTPDAGYLISGMTGRRCLALPPGHMNPALDADARYADLSAMMTTRDEQSFLRAAARYRPDYLLVSPPADRRERYLSVYSRWGSLEFVPLADSSVLVYRIRPPTAR